MGIEWLMAAAAAEHSSINSGIKQGVSQQNFDYKEHQLTSVPATTAGQMTNPYSSFGSLFQMSNMFQGSSSPSSSSSSPSSAGGPDSQSTAQSQVLPNSVNNWFINALSQYSMANRIHSPNGTTCSSKENISNSFCY